MRLIWAVDHALQRTSKQMERTIGVTGPQRLVLRIVGRFPGMSAGDLARLLHVHPSTLTGILARLERQGSIRRRADPRDRRRTLLGLTDRGRESDVATEGTIEAAVSRALAAMSPGKVQAAREVLLAIADSLEGRAGRKPTHARRPTAPRSRAPGRLLLGIGLLLAAQLAALPTGARTRTFCAVYSADCGREGQVACEGDSPLCDAGFAPITSALTSQLPYVVDCPFPLSDQTINSVCYDCGGDGQLGCTTTPRCGGGLENATTAGLHGPITACPSYLPDDPASIEISPPFSPTIVIDLPSAATLVNTAGVCTDGLPVGFSGASREAWPAGETPSYLRGTVFVLHGRGADCSGGRSEMLDSGTLYARNHLTYCVEYAQAAPPTPPNAPSIRTVRVLPVAQDETGAGPSECVAADDCIFDRSRPVVSIEAASLSVPAVATALAQAIEQVPTVGEITLVPHSQGGYVVRELLHRHYDDLRWEGKPITRVISLAHPYYAKEQDPQLYAPWLCAGAAEGNFDCAVGRWLRGWDDWIGGSGSGLRIDDGDFPQIEWTAVAGDGLAPNPVCADDPTPPTCPPEPAQIQTLTTLEGGSEACSYVFGGVEHSSVIGDTSVPIQSSLGIDEFDFYPGDQLDFDDRGSYDCSHEASCLFREPLLAAPSKLPAVPAPPTPPGSLDLDGVDDKIGVTDTAKLTALTMTDAFSVELWLRPERAGQDEVFLNKEGEYELGLFGGVLHWAIANGSPGWAFQSTGFGPPLHQWTHIAFTYDPALSKARTYANGVRVHEQTASGAIGDAHPAENQLWIGSRQRTPSEAFDGRIDEVRVWSHALSQAEIVAGLDDGLSGSEPGLAAWWRFDEGSGPLLLDASQTGADIALDSLGASSAPLRREGLRGETRDGGGLYFDGVDDEAGITEPDALAALEMDDALTLEAWVFPRGVGTALGGVILNKEGEYALTRLADGTLGFSLANTVPGWSTVSTGAPLPLRAWSHVALSYDAVAALVRAYVNGVQVYSAAASGPIGDFPAHDAQDELRIGGRQNNDVSPSDQWFHGVIDEVRVWRVARSGAQIVAAMNELVSPATPGLAAAWHFDEARTGVAFDGGPDGHHLALGLSRAAGVPARAFGPALPGYPATLVRDTDHDQLSDSDETTRTGTNPLAADTDGDGFLDGIEIAAGSDPLDAQSIPPPAIPALPDFALALLAALLAAHGRRSGSATRQS
ncbi:MAG TPA: LamG-like jellyroll fold domain-containing protein [Myxococcota bacterium]|nr:LamG-like jellyroll fold domain-containing protein [Myxococcota bacterium]